MKPLKLTDAEIEAGKSRKGGFKRAQLAKWGVPWPPPHGWRRALLAGDPIPSPNHPDKTRAPIDRSQPERALYSPDMTQKDAHAILRQVVVSVLNAGHASDLYEFPDVMRYFGANPDARPTAQLDITGLLDD